MRLEGCISPTALPSSMSTQIIISLLSASHVSYSPLRAALTAFCYFEISSILPLSVKMTWILKMSFPFISELYSMSIISNWKCLFSFSLENIHTNECLMYDLLKYRLFHYNCPWGLVFFKWVLVHVHNLGNIKIC